MESVIENLNRIAELESIFSSQDTINTLIESFEDKNISKKFETVDDMFSSIDKEG